MLPIAAYFKRSRKYRSEAGPCSEKPRCGIRGRPCARKDDGAARHWMRNEDVLCRVLSYLTLREVGLLTRLWPQLFGQASRRLLENECGLWRSELERRLPGLPGFLCTAKAMPPSAWRAVLQALLTDPEPGIVPPTAVVSLASASAEAAYSRDAWWREGTVLLCVSAIDERTKRATPLVALGWSVQLCLLRGVGGRRTPSYLYRADRLALTSAESLLAIDRSLVTVAARLYLLHAPSGAVALVDQVISRSREDEDSGSVLPRLAQVVTGLRLGLGAVRPNWLGLEMRPKRRADGSTYLRPGIGDFGFKLIWLCEPSPAQLLYVACKEAPLGAIARDAARQRSKERASRIAVAGTLEAVVETLARHQPKPAAYPRALGTTRPHALLTNLHRLNGLADAFCMADLAQRPKVREEPAVRSAQSQGRNFDRSRPGTIEFHFRRRSTSTTRSPASTRSPSAPSKLDHTPFSSENTTCTIRGDVLSDGVVKAHPAKSGHHLQYATSLYGTALHIVTHGFTQSTPSEVS